MTGRHADVVVIGAGLMGAASALALARRGHDVLALEARLPGHREGSSHGSTRIVRRSYVEPEYVAMSGRALELWREIEQLAGARLLTMTGGIDCGPGRDPGRLREALAAAGVRSELLSASAAAERWPQMRLPREVLYHPDAGVLDPQSAVGEMLRVARAAGARVDHLTPVLAVETGVGGVRVRTSAGWIAAGVVVTAAGPWLPKILHGVVHLPPLTVTRQQVFHFAPVEHGPASWQSWPVVLHADELDIFALPGGGDGLVPGNIKVAEHSPGPAVEPGGGQKPIDPVGRRRVVDYVTRFWPGLSPEPVAAYTCLYTWTPDRDFIVDRRGAVVVCSPCSGHGAKFAPLIGEWAADLVEGRALPYARFGLDRFH